MITLRQFLDVAQDIVETYLCYVYVYYKNEEWGNEICKAVKTINKISDLDEFLDDYYIVKFTQNVEWGEIVSQDIYLKKKQDVVNKDE